jgi:predicted ABC-type ATPase
MIPAALDRRPVIVALAGPNGAGKSTFYYTFLARAGLRFVNADLIARELKLDAYAAAKVAEAIRGELFRQRESFVFETVFSDPVGEKLRFLTDAAAGGYNVILCFVGLANADLSEERVAMRVSQGGHDVPTEKLRERFPRTLANLRRAIRQIPYVWIYDNTDLHNPFRKIAAFERGRQELVAAPTPGWLGPILEPA